MIRYFGEAEIELIEAAKFYEGRQTGLGQEFLNTIEAATTTIELHPRRFPLLRSPIRRYLLPSAPANTEPHAKAAVRDWQAWHKK